MTDEQNQQDPQLGNLNWTPDELAVIQAGGAPSLQINQIAEAGGAAAGEPSATSATTALSAEAGDTEAVSQKPLTTPETDASSAASALPISQALAEQSTSSVLPVGQETPDAPAVAELGEDAASLVGSQSASGTSSSVSPASLVAATPAEGASDVKSAIARLRDHLWTFEHSAVRHLHAELDKIEAWFK
ncbi:hypothetical protein [Burkholderia gladioli]